MLKDFRPLKVTRVTEEVYVVKDEIVSMEYEIISDYYGEKSRGTVMTLKNGRKIYVAGMKPNQIIDKLEGR